MTTGLWADLRAAWRALRAMRGSGLVTVLTLALAIGAGTAMFSVIYAALMRPLPFDQPDRLVMISLLRTSPRTGTTPTRFSFSEFTVLSAGATTFECVASYTRTTIAVEVPDPVQISGEFISPAYWTVLRIRPMLGRLTSSSDDGGRGSGAVAVVSARLWREHFGADPQAVGRSILVNGVPLGVIGVLADGFNGLSERADIWMPSTVAPELTYADYLTTPQHFIAAIARLGRGVTVARANAELAARGPTIANGGAREPDPAVTWSATSVPLNDARIQPAVRRSGWLLVGTIICVFVIACANVTSVLIARTHDRMRDVAVRRALGASAWRLLRQLLAESIVLTGLAGAMGAWLALWGIRLARMAAPATLPSTQTGYVQLSSFATPAADPAVLGFALLATLGATLFFSVIPMWEVSRSPMATSLRNDARTGSRRKLRTLHVVVIIEMAVAVMLVAGAALLVESARRLERQRVGFDPADVLTFRVVPPASRYRPEDGPRILEQLLTSVQGVPGVALAALNRCAPLDNGCARALLFRPGTTDAPSIERHYVSADYFRALGMPIKKGRGLTADDRPGRPAVTVISELAARRFWPGRNPVGERVWFSNPDAFADPAHPLTIVGVVGDVKYGTIDDPPGPDFYTSYLQFSYPDSLFVVKAEPGRSESLLPDLRRAVAAVDRGLPVIDPKPLEASVEAAWATPRFHAATVVTFALVALILSAIGVYGVATVAVTTRAREIGIRLALGADAREVVRLVMVEHLRLGLAGGLLGLGGALAASRLIRGLLYDVAPGDPRGLLPAIALLLAVVLAGSTRPARRASAVNPADLLRHE
jgi:putative ABC transport system permease protein